jgi:hypothetical protein
MNADEIAQSQKSEAEKREKLLTDLYRVSPALSGWARQMFGDGYTHADVMHKLRQAAQESGRT